MTSKSLRKVLQSDFCPENLKSYVGYTRVQDDHDGTFEGLISVQIDRQGDVWVMAQMYNGAPIRFRTWAGGGMSLRTRNALLILAEAIRLDNLDHPQIKNESSTST